MWLNFHTYLHGEPHQPVSFPFQKKNVQPEEDSPKVFSTYVHGISRGLCCSTMKKRMLQKIISVFSSAQIISALTVDIELGLTIRRLLPAALIMVSQHLKSSIFSCGHRETDDIKSDPLSRMVMSHLPVWGCPW